ncbi:MAG: hypothetical protein FJ143_00815 [Deltaproteobacteria bacterium]|nr:hypothetical protein [Deltaproteobacteria bacterium]
MLALIAVSLLGERLVGFQGRFFLFDLGLQGVELGLKLFAQLFAFGCGSSLSLGDIQLEQVQLGVEDIDPANQGERGVIVWRRAGRRVRFCVHGCLYTNRCVLLVLKACHGFRFLPWKKSAGFFRHLNTLPEVVRS